MANGSEIPTQYDQEGHPPSLDATMIMTIFSPMSQPRIHRSFPDSQQGLDDYVSDVVEGARNHMVSQGSWTYSYHKRLTQFPGLSWTDFPDGQVVGGLVNQLDYIVEQLNECWYTRRAQGISWVPAWDTKSSEPPCFQRMWLRGAQCDGKMYLDMNLHWRSRDALKAAFMNLYAFSALHKYLADRLSDLQEMTVYCGRIVDMTDSYHIYGKDRKEAVQFLRSIERRSFRDRTWNDSSGEDDE
jgi:thymidylate synthase